MSNNNISISFDMQSKTFNNECYDLNKNKEIRQQQKQYYDKTQYQIKHHDWMKYSLRLEKEIEALKIQFHNLEMVLVDKNKEIQKLQRQVDIFKSQKNKLQLSSNYQQNTLLRQQLREANKTIALSHAQNEWLKNKLNNQKESKEPKTNIENEEQIKRLRLSFELYQKRVEKQLADVIKYDERISSLMNENIQLKKSSEKQTFNLKKFNEEVGNQINSLESSFRDYLNIQYFSEDKQQ